MREPIGSALLVAALDLLLWRRLPPDLRERLRGRRVEIAVTDWQASFRFVALARGFVPQAASRAPDLRIAATARDFGGLAAGDEDADTLYFRRRLVVEGDTELALMVKNTLDALEDTPGRKLARRAHRIVCAIRGQPARSLT